MGWDGTGMNCYGIGWDGTEKNVPWTSLHITQATQVFLILQNAKTIKKTQSTMIYLKADAREDKLKVKNHRLTGK